MKSKIILLLCILLIFTLAGCGNSNGKPASKVVNEASKVVNEDSIASVKISNYKCEIKDVKNKSDITDIVKLINSVKIIKSNIDVRAGVGYGIEITYVDGNKDDMSFLGNSMNYNRIYYEIDKNIVDELKKIYDKN